MSDKQDPKPPGKHAMEQFEAIRPLAKLLGLDGQLRDRFRDVEQQFDNVRQIMADRETFGKTYGHLGWVYYDRLSTEIVSTVLGMAIEDGEVTLSEYHLDKDVLAFLRYRFSISHFEPWCALYERAVERAGAGDFLSAVPLVLSIIDGVCTTSTGKHPFSGGADAPVFDSQTSGPGGLSDGLALLGSTRRKLDTEAISAPFRHGIVHGLNPNYGNATVAAKAFNLLQATIDYFDRRRDEAQRIAKAADDQKPIDLSELSRRLRSNAEAKQALENWRARPPIDDIPLACSEAPAAIAADSPEACAAEYLTLLSARNYGGLARATVDYPQRPVGYRAGRLREELKEVEIVRWTITGIEDLSAAMTRLTVRLEGTLNGTPWGGVHHMRLMFANSEFDAVVRGQPDGTWFVMPDFVAGLWLLAIRRAREP